MRGLAHLVWKDFCIGGALLVIAAAVMCAVAVGVAGADVSIEHTDRWTAANYWAWMAAIVVPFIAAAGFPAQLVGSETETGTLDWLRTLPVSVARTVASKVAVTVVLLSTVWLLSWALFLRRSEYLHSYFLFGSFQALQVALTAFIFVLLARNTLVSLLLVVPVSAAATLAIGRLTVWIEDLPPYFTADRTSPVQIGLLALYCLLLLVALFAVVIPLRFAPHRGRWRLSALAREQDAGSVASARPVHAWPRTGMLRLGSFGALLWQQLHQSQMVYLGVVVLFSVAAVAAGAAWFGPLPLLLGTVGLSLLGSQSFASDSGSNYQLFLGTRGVRPALAWVTRLLPGVCLALLALAIAAAIVPQQDAGRPAKVIIVCSGFFLFAAAQLWAIWFRRPIVAHFAALAFGGFLLMFLTSGIAYLYPTFGWILALAAIGFLATTLSVASCWLDARRSWRFHLALSLGLAGSMAVACGIALAVRLLDRPWGLQPASVAVAGSRDIPAAGPPEELPDALRQLNGILQQRSGRVPLLAEADKDGTAAETIDETSARRRAELEPLLGDLLQQDAESFAPLFSPYLEGLQKLPVLSSLARGTSSFVQYGNRGSHLVQEYPDSAPALFALVLRAAQAMRYNTDLPSQRTADQYEVDALSHLEHLLRAGEVTPQQREWIRASLIDAKQREALRQRALAAWLPRARRNLNQDQLDDFSLALMRDEQKVRIRYIPGEKSRTLAWLDAIAAVEMSAGSSRSHERRAAVWGQVLGLTGAGVDAEHLQKFSWNDGLPWTSAPEQLTARVGELLQQRD